MTPAERSLMEKLEEADCNVLDVNANSNKPYSIVTIEGTTVPPSFWRACKKFGYNMPLETKPVKRTDVDEATMITLEHK